MLYKNNFNEDITYIFKHDNDINIDIISIIIMFNRLYSIQNLIIKILIH